MDKSYYRADIDGLRAIAVLSVIFFHVGFETFSGGFVGVDIFFVISGFLITRLIRDGIIKGNFNFANFYVRRARRLFPALFFTLVLSFFCAFFIFSLEDLERFGGALFYSVLSISNFYFWGESGYFDTEAIQKPLLHTWSLSVEDQFYLIWPILLFLLLTKIPRWITPIVLLIFGILSLFLTEYFIDNTSAIFYLTPFRIVEFAIGALIVWLIKYQFNNKLILELCFLIGLILIAYPIFTYTKDTIFPGINVLMPCFGTALLIYSGTNKYSSKLFNNPIMVGIGLISYSLYLIHWPIIVFYKDYYILDKLTQIEMYIIVILSIAIAKLMYHFVEMPFRYNINSINKQRYLSAPAFGFVCAMCAIIISVPATHTWANGGWDWRIDKQIRTQMQIDRIDKNTIQKYVRSRHVKLRKATFSSNRLKKVLIVGDSQSADFVNMIFENNYHRNVEIKTLSISADCQAIIPTNNQYYQKISKRFKKYCRRVQKKLANLGGLEPDIVVLASLWKKHSIPHINHTASVLSRKGAKIYVLGNKIQGMAGQDVILKNGRINGIEKFSAKFRNKQAWDINNKISSLNDNFIFIDLMSIVCSSINKCHVLTPNNKIIFFQPAHLTPAGAKFLGQKLFENIKIWSLYRTKNIIH